MRPGDDGLTQCVTIALPNVAQRVIDETTPASGHPIAIATPLISDKALAKIEKLIQDANAEAQRVDRDPLVHPVEHACEIQVGGQPERGEAEAPDT